MGDYALGVDLGTTYTAAAVARGTAVEMCTLGTTAPQIASIVVARQDGEILTGEAAERRAPSEPTRTAREFKRRLGDPVPIIVGGTPYGAEALMAHLLKAVVTQVGEREGSEPSVVVLTHPANYTDYKRELLREAARLAGLDLARVLLLTEPEAAAIAYASQERVDAGSIVAVYDLGGGTFDAAVVRRTDVGFEVLGTPEGMERLGGVDFDQAVLAHVDESLDGMVGNAATEDPSAAASLARLREDARRAKEALSSDTDTAVLVALPGLQTEVRLTREELETMVRPRVAETVDALERAIASAGIGVDDVSRVLLVGGSSRMPVVGEEVRRATGRPVATDAHPKFAIATGAALAGARAVGDAPQPAAVVDAPAEGPVDGATAPRQHTLGLAAAGAAGGAAATLAASTLAGGSAAAAGAATVAGAAHSAASAAEMAGPAGVALSQGPTGAPLAGVGPGGTATAPPPPPPPQPPTPPGPPPARPRPPRRAIPRRVAIGAGAAVGVAVVAGALVVSQPNDEPPAAAPAPATTTTAESASTTLAPTPVGSTPPAAAGRGLSGAVTVVAGNGLADGKGRPGPAEDASLGTAPLFATAPNGDLFVTNHENELLLVSDGQTKVVYRGDSAAGESGFGGVAVGPDGDAYVTMGTGVKRIGRDGSGKLVVDAKAEGLRGPLGAIAFDGAGNLYFFEGATARVLRWAASGGLSAVAGTGSQGRPASAPDGDGGPAIAASLTGVNEMVLDAKGNLLLAESGRPLVRRISPDGTITTIAGGGATELRHGTELADEGTKATDLRFAAVSGITVDPAGRLYVSDGQAHTVSRFTADGGLQLVAADQDGAVAAFGTPANAFQVLTVAGMGFDGGGNLLFQQGGRILRVAGAGRG